MFYPRAFLEQRIKEERFRTYRTGSPFSVVLLRPFKLVADRSDNRKRSVGSIIEFLNRETRETDIKGWWNRSTIVILLLDTTAEDALVLVEKLLARIRPNNRDRAKSIKEGHFEIFTFPNTQRLETRAEDKRAGEGSRIPEQESTQNFQTMHFERKPLNDNRPIQNFSRKHRELIKRCMDIVLSIAALTVLSPLFLLCALLIKLDSPGRVFYRQTRVSKDGKCFTLLKFRSMQHDADEEIHKYHVKNLINHRAGLSSDRQSDEKTYKLIDDHRITRIGRFLRGSSLDELPQLINVLKGDMTFVGPRPHPVYEVEQYELWQSHRLSVKPGITGLGQIMGRSDTEYEDVYRFDIRYLKWSSLIFDLKILLKTIPLVLSRRGAR